MPNRMFCRHRTCMPIAYIQPVEVVDEYVPVVFVNHHITTVQEASRLHNIEIFLGVRTESTSNAACLGGSWFSDVKENKLVRKTESCGKVQYAHPRIEPFLVV